MLHADDDGSFPASKSQGDVEQACNATPFPTLGADGEQSPSLRSLLLRTNAFDSRSSDRHPPLS